MAAAAVAAAGAAEAELAVRAQGESALAEAAAGAAGDAGEDAAAGATVASAVAAGRSRSRSPRRSPEPPEPRESGAVWQREQVCAQLRCLAAEQRTCHTCLEAFAAPAAGQRLDFAVVPGCGHAVHGRCLAGQVISVNDDIQGKCGMCRRALVLTRRDRMLVYMTALVKFIGSMKAALREGASRAGSKEDDAQKCTRAAASRCLAEFCVKLYLRIGASLDLPGPSSVLCTMGASLDELDEACNADPELQDIMELALPLLEDEEDAPAHEVEAGEASSEGADGDAT